MTILMWLLVLEIIVSPALSLETQDVCSGYDFSATCEMNEVLVMTSSEFGRMAPGECLAADSIIEFGCTNDVLLLTDKWCSGKKSCEFNVPNKDIMEANIHCKQVLAYFSATYSCVKVRNQCSSHQPTKVTNSQGAISSQITEQNGCGSGHSPWQLQAQPGQTIELTLLDFSALDRATSHSLSSCSQVYGFILERALNINHTICGSKERETVIYTSKTSDVEIHMKRQKGSTFLLKYQANGCPEPIPPSHAWYKRTGNEAVIGCESNNKQWQLTCSGNTWRGNVGNCTTLLKPETETEKSQFEFEFSTIIIVAGIIGATVVLGVSIIVCGVVYLHRYRDCQDKKHTETLTLQRKDPGVRSASLAHYRPMSSTLPAHQEEYLQPNIQSNQPTNTRTQTQPPEEPLIHIWETSLPKPHGNTGTASTTQPQRGAANLGNTNNTRPNSGSYYSPNTGNKYYVLDREA